MLVYVADQKELFSRSAVFSKASASTFLKPRSHHASWLRARYLPDPGCVNRQPEYRDDQLHRVRIDDRLTGKTPLHRDQARLSRQLRHFRLRRKFSIQSTSAALTAVVHRAGDRPGLLSRISRTLTAFDINLHAAKINTLAPPAPKTLRRQRRCAGQSKTRFASKANCLTSSGLTGGRKLHAQTAAQTATQKCGYNSARIADSRLFRLNLSRSVTPRFPARKQLFGKAEITQIVDAHRVQHAVEMVAFVRTTRA